MKFPAAPVQPHYQVINASNQVQIYQELIRDSDGVLTTSFLRRVDPIKDNRIRPQRLRSGILRAQSVAVHPGARPAARRRGRTIRDYTDPRITGADKVEYSIPLDAATLERADHVEVQLYYQSIPPSYLQQRFQDATHGPAAQDDIQATLLPHQPPQPRRR